LDSRKSSSKDEVLPICQSIPLNTKRVGFNEKACLKRGTDIILSGIIAAGLESPPSGDIHEREYAERPDPRGDWNAQ
jgi:hypothetical protein